MKKFALSTLFLFSFLIAPSLVNAQFARSTSFDDRPICEESKGIWREFGNGCADNCESKFDKYEVCTTAITYACDCGKGRCWNKNKCIAMSAYKVIFDKEAEENEKLLAKKAQERTDRIKNDPALNNYMHNLYVKKDEAKAAEANGGAANAVPQNQAQAQQQAQAQAINQQNQALIAADPTSGVTPPPSDPVTQLVITPANPSQAVAKTAREVPPFFAQKEARKKEAEATKSNAQQPAATDSLPALPIIPLP